MPKFNKCQSLGRAYARKQRSDQQIPPENESISEEEITQDNNDDIKLVHFAGQIKIDDIGDLFELIEARIDLKTVTVLLYMILRHFSINWVKYDDF